MNTSTSTTISGQIRAASSPMVLHLGAGFFFGVRMCLTFLFFQNDPRLGTEFSMTLSLILLCAAFLYSYGDAKSGRVPLLHLPLLGWILLYLAWSGASLLWTGAASRVIAAAYWSAMAADVFTVIFLLHVDDAEESIAALMKGFVVAALVVAAVAWGAPRMDDMRLGNEEFLHPNGLGLEFGVAIFLAQHVARRNGRWHIAALALAVTLLRTISKTSILAFAVAQCFYLLREKRISRRARIAIGVVLIVAAGCFWALYSQYLGGYADAGNQAETLTGRTAIWEVSLVMIPEHLWVGHGIYSFRALIPAFGVFEPWHAHNELLQQLFEYGVVGALVALAIYFNLFLLARRRLANPYSLLIAALLLFALIRGLADTVNFGLSFPLWLMTVFALAGASRTHGNSNAVGGRP